MKQESVISFEERREMWRLLCELRGCAPVDVEKELGIVDGELYIKELRREVAEKRKRELARKVQWELRKQRLRGGCF